jgi:translation initiation factor 6
MHIQKFSIKASPFVGVFMRTTDRYCLVPTGLSQKEKKLITDTLSVELIETRIGNSNLLGVLCVATADQLFVPDIAEPDEITALKAQGLDIHVLHTFEALGNHIAFSGNRGICGNALREETRKAIEAITNTELRRVTVGRSDLVGSATVATARGFLCHPNASEEEFETLREILQTDGKATSANWGDLFVGNSVVANKNGALVGEHTTGHEMLAIDDALH